MILRRQEMRRFYRDSEVALLGDCLFEHNEDRQWWRDDRNPLAADQTFAVREYASKVGFSINVVMNLDFMTHHTKNIPHRSASVTLA